MGIAKYMTQEDHVAQAKRIYELNNADKINQKLQAQLEVATTTLKAIAADPETYEGILANKCLAELKRLEDDPLKQLVQEAQEMGLYDPPKGEKND